jgi:ABC-type uncharacterized transport system permease subunit
VSLATARNRPILTLAAIAAGTLALVAGLVLLAGADPLAAGLGIVRGAFGEPYMVGETLVTAVPLALIGLSIIPAIRAGIFSVGAEGQMAMGALAATAFVNLVPGLPATIALPGAALAGAVAGALWSGLAGVLKLRLRVNEILSTLLLNYIAGFFLLWSLRSWLATPAIVPLPQSAALPDPALIGKLWAGTRLHWAALAVPLLALGLGWWLRTRHALGAGLLATNPLLGRRIGLSPYRTTLGVFLFSGAIAGLAGWMQVAGVAGTLYPSVAGGIGFAGIMIALLGGLNPVGVLVAALLFAGLQTGASGLQAETGVPSALSTIIEGAVLLCGALAFSLSERARRTTE